MPPQALRGVFLAVALLTLSVPASAQYNLYYGNFHAHCNLSDDAQGAGSGPPSTAFTYARDTAGIDVLALTDHTHYMSVSEYSFLQTEATTYTTNGVFVALAAQEHGSLSTSRVGAFGHLNTYEAPDLIPQYTNGGDDFRYNLTGTYNYLATHIDDLFNPLVGAFNHPYSSAGAGSQAQFADFAYDTTGDDAMQLIEVLNGKRTSSYESEYFEVLAKGWHVGAVGNQDNHSGEWGDQVNNAGNIPLTGIWAPALTKQDVLEALAARRTFAMEVDPPTDRMSIKLTADGNWMGSEYSTAADTVAFTVEVSAATNIASLSLYRNGALIRSTGVGATSFTWNTFDTPGPGDFYYFVRVSQSDGDRAWTSPIWIESTSTFTLPIAAVNEDDANGIPLLWLQSNITVQGLVTVDTDTLSTIDNLFHIQDATGGLQILEDNVQNYPVNLGDNVLVTGQVNFTNGQTFMVPTNVTIQSTGGAPPPVVITTNELATNGETYESQLVEIKDVTITGGTWPTPGNNGSVTIDDGSGGCELLINLFTSLDDLGAPAEPFTVRGLVTQEDLSLPYFSSYRLTPRYEEDIFQDTVSGVDELPAHHVFAKSMLLQNTPNPFRPRTTIRFDLGGTVEQRVELIVYDVNGRRVKSLLSGNMPPGSFEASWDGRSDRGRKVAAGVYFYRLVTKDGTQTRKMVLLK